MKLSPESPWRLRFDLVSTRTLLWFAAAGRTGEPTPEVHRYLSDRYARLARYHERRGHERAARRLWESAEFHWQLAGPEGPPPAVAVTLPLPPRLTFTNAIARWRDGDSGRGVA